MKEKVAELYNKNNNTAHKAMLELEILTTTSKELYDYFEELLNMLDNEKTFVRVRGFRLICSLSKWDTENKINKNINKILNELDDNTSTSVRQCLGKLNLILLYKVELTDLIIEKLNNLNVIKYKESIQKLILEDIEALKKGI